MTAMFPFDVVIGLEVHVQLATRSKIFCGCPARPPSGVSVGTVPVNSMVCPICAGHPGVLPVLNAKVVEFAVKAGLSLGCRVRSDSIFARKHYFYPDLPKGYQISQFEHPICEGGALEIDLGRGEPRLIRLRRIHIEEDAGKSQHESGRSLVNLNRAGVPLLEIVSEPDLQSAEEAGAYLRELYGIVTAIGICAGNLEEGNFRCDANISLKPRGAAELGTRVEIKNVNSFRFLEKAIEFERVRQAELLKAGGRVIQETRGYDSFRDVTFSLRSKEEAEDYRYFPDPDLPSPSFSQSELEQWRLQLPELPGARRRRLVERWGLSAYEAGVLVNAPVLAKWFEEATAVGGVPRGVSSLLAGEVARRLNENPDFLGTGRLRPLHLAELSKAMDSGELSSTAAKRLLQLASETGESVGVLMDREGLRQNNDEVQLVAWVEEVFRDFPAQVQELKAGKQKVLGFLVGQLMSRSGGRANPSLLQELIRRKLRDAT